MKPGLSEAAKKAIDAWLKKYPSAQRQSGLLFALKFVQAENKGWLSQELMEAVAAYLNIPEIAVLEAAAFYSQFELKPIGRYKISVCNSVSCLLNNAEKIQKHLKKRLETGFNETTLDGQFTLKKAECLAACSGAPVISINGIYHEKMTPKKIDKLLTALRSQNV